MICVSDSVSFTLDSGRVVLLLFSLFNCKSTLLRILHAYFSLPLHCLLVRLRYSLYPRWHPNLHIRRVRTSSQSHKTTEPPATHLSPAIRFLTHRRTRNSSNTHPLSALRLLSLLRPLRHQDTSARRPPRDLSSTRALSALKQALLHHQLLRLPSGHTLLLDRASSAALNPLRHRDGCRC